MSDTSARLRTCTRLRMSSVPLADLIPLLQSAADELDAKDARIAELEYQLKHAEQYAP